MTVRNDANGSLLDDVWDALGTLRPLGLTSSLTELGCVTAVSTNGSVLRVLLRMPSILCQLTGPDKLLADLDEVLHEIAPLANIEYDVKQYPTQGGPGQDVRAASARPAVPASGQELDTPPQHRAKALSPREIGARETVRVFVRAQVVSRDDLRPDTKESLAHT